MCFLKKLRNMFMDKRKVSKADLLRLLDDPEVCAKIMGIVKGMSTSVTAGTSVSTSESKGRSVSWSTSREGVGSSSDVADSHVDEVAALQKELADQQRELAKLKSDKIRLERTLAASEREKSELEKVRSLYEQLETKVKPLEKKLNSLESSVSRFQSIYELYLSLPAALRKNLKGYFNESDMWSFVVCGVQPDNIRDFWDYCKNDLARGRLRECRDKLREIFMFFFDLINESLGETWILQRVPSGASFDTACLSSTLESAVSGKVQEVVWPGMLYATNKKVFRKSLVVVK